jgi:hypothetical protein
MLHKIAVLAFVTLGMPAVANAMPQTQDEWFVDSGRYLNGQIVSYDQAPADRHIVAYAPADRHIVAYAGTRRATRLIEGRSSANIGLSGGYYGGPDYSATGREGLIHAN